MRIFVTVMLFTFSVLPSFGIMVRKSHADSVDTKTDSIVTIYYSDFAWYKLKSVYNENGKKINDFLYNYHPREDRQLSLHSKNEYIYDKDNKLIKSIGYWGINKYETVYKYNSYGNKVKEIYKECLYFDKRKYSYKYDTNGNITETTQYRKNKKRFQHKSVYTYDMERNILKTTKYGMHDSYREHKQSESFYNKNRNVEKEISYKWNAEKKISDTTRIDLYTYDEQLNKESHIRYYYQTGTEGWYRKRKTGFIYDDKKKTIVDYEWNQEQKEWIMYAKTNYVYDNNGNPLEIYDWPEKNKSEYNYKYNEKGEIAVRSEIAYKKNEKDEWIPFWKKEYELKDNMAVESFFYFKEETNEWFPNPHAKDTYYYSSGE